MLYHCKAATSTLSRSRIDMQAKARLTKQANIIAPRKLFPAAVAALLTIIATLACDVERRKTDAELGLSAQQSAGRRIYDAECDRCHEPYSTRGKKGPGLKGMFQRKYLPLSGLPANDDRVTDIIRLGRNEMPAYSQKLNSQDMQDLLAYLHTL